MADPIDKDTRGPVNLRIKFRSESLQQFIERYGVDVSRGGIFIRTREPLPVGTRLKLDFQLVDTAPLFQGEGTVVWIREHDPARAGVTPGMGVRFDRLSAESQTTLDTILEEKIRLQQSGVAPGSVAKAGAGIAVRRPSGAFATLDLQAGKPALPPPLPVEVKRDTPIAPIAPTAGPAGAAGAAPVAPMPMSSSRSGPHAAGSSSIFTRPRTTSGGLRTVPVPSALFEAPTAADIDKALSVLEEKGGPAPSLPVVPTLVHSEVSHPLGEDEPTKVFDSAASQEFSANEAITGPAPVLPESGIPIVADDGGEGDLTTRRDVDPADADARAANGEFDMPSAFGGRAAAKPNPTNGEATPGTPAAGSAAVLDAPLASLVDSGAAPPAKPPAPPQMKPAAPTSAKPPAAPAKSGVPIRITTDRPAATESGRFRSDTRYKRRRSKTPIYALVSLVIVGGGVYGAVRYVKIERAKREAAALAAASAAPPFAAGQGVAPPSSQPTPTAGAGEPGTPTPNAGAGGEATEKAQPAKTGETTGQKTGETEAKTVEKTEVPPDQAAKPEKAQTVEAAKAAEKPSVGKSGGARKRERAAAAAAGATAKPVAEKTGEAGGEKRPAGDEAAKTGGETAKAGGEAKSGEAAKAGEKTGEGEKTAEAAKSGEKTGEKAGEKTGEGAAPPPPAATTDRPMLKITSSPAGADVVIDGVPVGTTPFSSRDVTADATHAISVKKDGYETHERMISGSDWARGKGGVQSLKFNIKLKRTGGAEKPAADTGEKKEAKPEVEILTPSEP